MQVAPFGADVLRDVGGEGDHVVLHLLLDFENPLDFKPALAADGARGALGNQARFGFDLRRGDFHLEPLGKVVFVRPDATHFRARVAWNHGFWISDLDFAIFTLAG